MLDLIMFKAYQLKWAIFLSLIFFIIGLLSQVNKLQWNNIPYLANMLVNTFLLIIPCWLIQYYIISHRLGNIKQPVKIILAILLSAVAGEMISYLLIISGADPDNKPNAFSSAQDVIIWFSRISLLCMIIYAIVHSIYTNIILQRSRLENERLQQAKLRAQLLSLQQQLSPHFLFNSLSTLKTIAPDSGTKTYIIQLANVYRYLLNFNEHHLASIKDELTFLRSYLYILQERYEEALHITIDIPEQYYNNHIPPLSLQLLVENALKHNTISPEQPLYIRIFTDNTPALIIENGFQPKMYVEDSTGKGLQNIKDRYELMGGKAILVHKDEQHFTVTLPLFLK
ncbi:histidine kinase [Chitinophaga pendula]|uniref:sensor histidine kinase n=1 Tax=Chitinophaga TaxID=79328 RepID=UPI000BB0A8D0|nr:MULTISPECIES: histidine kinase [Chitinophaga]ASZ13015.1 sensor histidine kinase [Chitinophaga sp. MD30]UCJ09355.1 histidine kinase [Chitinophaga pendula]